MGRDVDQLGWNWYYEPLDFDGWIPDFVIDYGYKPVLVDVKPYTSFGEDDGLNAKIRQHKKDASKASVTAGVSIGPRDAGGFGLAVKLHVKDSTLPASGVEALANEAHEKICPYSNATRGNVDVQLEVKGA